MDFTIINDYIYILVFKTPIIMVVLIMIFFYASLEINMRVLSATNE